MYGRRMMNENDRGISLSLDKPPSEDKPISPSSMTRRYKVNNEPSYRWGCIFPFKTQQGYYKNNTTIKKTPTARRRENTPIYMSTRNSTKDREKKYHSSVFATYCYYFYFNPSDFGIGGFVAGAISVTTFHPSTIYFYSTGLAQDKTTPDEHSDWRSW